MSRLVQILGLALAVALVVKVLAWVILPLVPALMVLFLVALLGTLILSHKRHL